MVFTIQKMRKCLNYRYFRIDDQMVDGFFEKSGFFVNFGGKKIAYLWLKYLIVSTLISIIKVADVRIF